MLRSLIALATVGLTFGWIILDEGDNQRIVGGHNITIEEAPWQVSLEKLNRSRHFCGGSIINRFTIVTAAHCVKTGDENKIRVHFGSTIRASGGYYRNVRKIIQHWDYSKKTFDSDIALVIVNLPIIYGSGVQPIRLPDFNFDLSINEVLFLSGWGRTKEGAKTIPNVLQGVELSIIDQEFCAEKYSYLPKYPEITDNMFCAGVQDIGGKDSCQGDSGGPVVHRSKLGNILYGVVSWGFGCARPSHPGVYTRVSRFLQWIEHKSFE